ncbi:MAG: glutamate--tRNA ligase, partial [Planctomycetota bacterium]
DLLSNVLESNGWKKPFLFMPLRFALTSRKDSPDLIEVIEVLGVEKSCTRINRAIDLLKESR